MLRLEKPKLAEVVNGPGYLGSAPWNWSFVQMVSQGDPAAYCVSEC